MQETPATTSSPCVGICTMDDAGYCIGCGRTLAEIEGRSDAGELEQEEIIATAAARLSAAEG